MTFLLDEKYSTLLLTGDTYYFMNTLWMSCNIYAARVNGIFSLFSEIALKF